MASIIKNSSAVFIFVIAIISSGCVSDDSPLAGSDQELQLGREIYINNCSSCHGAMGEGRNGSKLNEGALTEAYPKAEDQKQILIDGKGAMPSFASKLSGAEIDAVARYTREILSGE